MQYIDVNQLAKKISRSQRNVYDLVRVGILPKPLLMGTQNVWREDLVDLALNKLAEEQANGWKELEAAATAH